MSATSTSEGWEWVLAILGVATLVLASVSAFFGGDCGNIINAAFDGAMALIELPLLVGPLLLVVVGVWYLIWGRNVGMGTISWYTLGIGAGIFALGLLFSDVSLSSVGTEQCVNGIQFIK
jgi:hypothetical protein